MPNNQDKYAHLHVKGAIKKVEPIRKLEDIERVRDQILKDGLIPQPKILKYRNLALFTIGINTNLRPCDLVRIEVGNVEGIKPMDRITMREKKTGKLRSVIFNSECVKAIRLLLREYRKEVEGKLNECDPLLPSFHMINNRINPTSITTATINRLVKGWCKKIGLKGNYGGYTLRKTWGYHQRVTYGVGIAELMVCFNHSSMDKTLGYLCIDNEEIINIFNNKL